ncbi:ATP-grasp domain-containing protein [Kitasatospora cheerisanensis]|uniref:Putative siderophore biosynthesis protein n=1 Tax=Kitasatospora cheerisanensis KCTC 2395 TaxID=1348663 RepID=A0A066YHZ5_9ACTN|nr:ATP-grasp domain-containing protein [Kitasatospora cheerisanensis]KDN81113.1 putative siderophore biosynthesis protein [Kitasatospora cheerisanensis KCTC 2395]
MRLYLLALNPTDSVTDGFLPAAARLGLDVTVLTDSVEDHRRAYADREFAVELVECEVRDFRAVISTVSQLASPDAVFSNSDHLQTQTALAAEYFGLPAKDWRAALRAKDKGQLRRHLARTGLDAVRAAELPPGADPAGLDVPFPCVVKPREGVASEDVSLVADAAELARRCAEIRARRAGATLVVEEFLAGELHTLETLGDGHTRHVLGGFRTRLSPPPDFIEEVLTFVPAHPEDVTAQVLAQLDALGVGLGACHTEFVVQPDGRARIIEVNYRAIGDQCDLMLARILGIPFFELVLRAHLGERLPADLGLRTDRRARNEPVLAGRAGTLVAAPGPFDREADGVTLSYRPVRRIGERHELYRTNRDYLGVVWATGPSQQQVDAAVAGFLAANRWEITP